VQLLVLRRRRRILCLSLRMQQPPHKQQQQLSTHCRSHTHTTLLDAQHQQQHQGPNARVHPAQTQTAHRTCLSLLCICGARPLFPFLRSSMAVSWDTRACSRQRRREAHPAKKNSHRRQKSQQQEQMQEAQYDSVQTATGANRRPSVTRYSGVSSKHSRKRRKTDGEQEPQRMHQRSLSSQHKHTLRADKSS
jgi:hypothetical protein